MDYDKIKDTSLDRHMPHHEFVLQMRIQHTVKDNVTNCNMKPLFRGSLKRA